MIINAAVKATKAFTEFYFNLLAKWAILKVYYMNFHYNILCLKHT